MYYSGWVEGALRSSRQALTRRFVDVRAPGASATLGQSLARLYAARTALLPGDGSSNSRGRFDVGVLAGRRHLANEKWCARRAVPCCLPVRRGVAVAPMDGWGTRRYSGRGGRSLRCGLKGGHMTTAKFGPNQRRSRCAEFARVLAANFRDT